MEKDLQKDQKIKRSKRFTNLRLIFMFLGHNIMSILLKLSKTKYIGKTWQTV